MKLKIRGRDLVPSIRRGMAEGGWNLGLSTTACRGFSVLHSDEEGERETNKVSSVMVVVLSSLLWCE